MAANPTNEPNTSTPTPVLTSPSVITDAGLCELWRCLKKYDRKTKKVKKVKK